MKLLLWVLKPTRHRGQFLPVNFLTVLKVQRADNSLKAE